MRYKNFVWPHNPRVYSIGFRRTMGADKVPFGRYVLQDLGPEQRIMEGEGEFVGENAYELFKQLATVFYSDGPGLLVHPVWQTSNAYFVELSLTQEPRADYVRYHFTFWESYDGHSTGTKVTTNGNGGGQQESAPAARSGAVVHGGAGGHHVGIARKYGVSLTALVALNPQIKNPNLILVGQKVRVA